MLHIYKPFFGNSTTGGMATLLWESVQGAFPIKWVTILIVSKRDVGRSVQTAPLEQPGAALWHSPTARPDRLCPEAGCGLAVYRHEPPIQTGTGSARPGATAKHRKITSKRPWPSQGTFHLVRAWTTATHSSGCLSCGWLRSLAKRCRSGECGNLEAVLLEWAALLWRSVWPLLYCTYNRNLGFISKYKSLKHVNLGILKLAGT